MKKCFLNKFICYLLLLIFTFIALNTSFEYTLFNFKKLNKSNQTEYSSSAVLHEYFSIIAEENSEEDSEPIFKSHYFDFINSVILNLFDFFVSESYFNKQYEFIFHNYLGIYTFICCYRN
jgi:hypothetical protein